MHVSRAPSQMRDRCRGRGAPKRCALAPARAVAGRGCAGRPQLPAAAALPATTTSAPPRPPLLAWYAMRQCTKMAAFRTTIQLSYGKTDDMGLGGQRRRRARKPDAGEGVTSQGLVQQGALVS